MNARRLPVILSLLCSMLVGGLVVPAAAGASHRPAARTVVDVDMGARTLTLSRDGRAVRTLRISGGNEQRFCSRGRCQRAHTPRGTFTVSRKIPGVRRAPLGTLYSPMYFKGGYALHGSYSVPRHHASHGCVRVRMADLRWLYANVPVGTTVRVHD